jgi:putative flavoprotein involved in K+ transport
VLATGMSGKANMPKLPGMERFKGDQHHSSKHPGPDAYQAASEGGGHRLEQLGT